MLLYDRGGVCGAGAHYQGWPCIVSALQKAADGRGVLLDDFADASYSYLPIPRPRTFPWSGIFHHPVQVRSPLASDTQLKLRNLSANPMWTPPVRAVALTEHGAEFLRNWLGIPTAAILHGIDAAALRWRPCGQRRLVQIGSTLRNTRAIYDFACPGYSRYYLRSNAEWSLQRDRQLNACGAGVEDIGRLGNGDYDELLRSSVVFAEYFGVAASNLIIECVVRGTPLLVNRLPGVEEYLGSDYPLYLDSYSLSDQALEDASEYLLDRSRILPSVHEFAERVRAFLDCSAGTDRCPETAAQHSMEAR